MDRLHKFSKSKSKSAHLLVQNETKRDEHESDGGTLQVFQEPIL